LLAAIASAQAQNFVNLDFEGIRFTPPPDSFIGPLTWDEAIPGWSHSQGDSTDVVNYRYEHLGFSQNYVLLDRTVADPRVITGSFAIGMKSGTLNEHEPRGDVVQAFIAQRGWVPTGTTTLHLRTNSDLFSVLLDGVTINMHRVDFDPPPGPTFPEDWFVGERAGDISAFPGRVAELKIADGGLALGQARLLVVDDIQLVAVPEPTSAALMLGGLAAGVLLARRRARPAT
jgi:hypothetical protein